MQRIHPIRLGVALTLVSITAAGLWLHYVLWGFRSDRPVSLEIAAGTPARRILAELQDNHLLPSTLAARLYLRAQSHGRSLHFGRYQFNSGLRPVDVLEIVLDGNVEMFEITVVEGESASEIGHRFSTVGVGTEEEWRLLVTRVDWIAPAVPDAPSLEGFLFPDTYRFAVGVNAESAARHLTERFLSVWREERAASGAPWGTSLEMVTLASLVEAETSIDAERAVIAGVFVNRLRRGMLLQCDPTVVYALRRRNEWQGRLLRVHWEVDDPYNTYRYPGLPPGPINSPGRAALAGALHPEATPYLYFVARPGGGHTFSRTLTEHNQAVAELRASRR